MNLREEKFDVVFLWKQNDSGIYGRRADMMLKELAQCEWVDKIVEFDAPIEIDVLEKNKKSVEENTHSHYDLIYDNAFKGYWGSKKIYGVSAYTYIYAKRGSMHNEYSLRDSYFKYVEKIINIHNIGKTNKVLLWNCPINYDLPEWITFLQPSYIISDIIDDQRAWSKNPKSIQQMTDNYLFSIRNSDLLLVNCEEMYNRVLAIDATAKQKLQLIPNGCEAFCNNRLGTPELLKTMTGPIIGQVSNLEKKIDIELIAKCAEVHPEWNIVLIGSTHASDGIEKLNAYHNIYLTGPIPYEDAKNYISNFDVAMIAHRITTINKAMNPLKLYVYCSLGASVVSTNIPGITDLKKIIRVADTHEDFIEQIEEALENKHIYSAEDIELVNKFSWKHKIDFIAEKVSLSKEPARNRDVLLSITDKEEPMSLRQSIKKIVKKIVFKFPVSKWAFKKWENINNKCRTLETRIRELNDRIRKNTTTTNEKLLRLERRIAELENQMFILNSKTSLQVTDRSFVENQTKNKSEKNIALPSVTIIINQLGTIQQTKAQLDSILSQTGYDNYKVILIKDQINKEDNIEDSRIKTIYHQSGSTYTDLLNQIATNAESEYLVFLQNVLYLSKNWLLEMLNLRITNTNAGAVSAHLHFQNNRPMSQGGTTANISKLHFKGRIKQNLYEIFFDFPTIAEEHLMMDAPTSSVALCSSCMLISKEHFISEGCFDSLLTNGYEGVDLSLKLHKAGLRNYVCTNVFALINQPILIEDKNYNIFKCRWQSYLSREIFEEKLDGNHLFSREKFTIGIIGSDNDSSILKELITLNQKADYIIKFISEDIAKDNAVGIEVDLLVCVNGMVCLDNIKTKKNDLYSLLLVTKSAQINMQLAIEMGYTLVLNEQAGLLFDLSSKRVKQLVFSIETVWETIKQELRLINTYTIDENSIDILGGMPSDDAKKSWGDYHYALSLKREFEKHGFVANVKCHPEWFEKSNSKYVLVLRGIHEYYPKIEKQKVIMWNISHPADVTAQEYNLCDLIYVASERYIKTLSSFVTVPIKPLLQCTDENVMKYTPSMEKKYELLFVGNSRGIFRKILQDLLPTKYNLTVYGRAWEKYIPHKYIAGTYLDNKMVGQAYHDSTILLNDHWDDMRDAGLISNRLFDALAVGAFVISDNIPEIETVFDGSVVTYNDREDLKEKIDYYITHPQERKTLAERGQKIVLRDHTFAVRVETILNDIKHYEL